MNIFHVLLFIFTLTQCGERITSFVSILTVKTDGTICVQEEIDVISENRTINHGIVREFPTKYSDRWGINYNVGFKILSVTCDGGSVPFTVQSVDNGKKIYIGDKDVFVSRGKHSYVITYETTRQVGFFEKHDEIYWNVTGCGWRLPIEQVEAYVQLPEGIKEDLIGAEAYTGYYGDQGNKYTYSIEGNRVQFLTTQKLKQHEGITIVVTFPKGVIHEPSLQQKTWWLFRDNLLMVFLVLACLLHVILFVIGSIKAMQINKPGVVIPIFYPPEGMMPSSMGFMNNRKFDATLLSADVVNLAVQGFITIEYDENVFWGGTYILKLKDTLEALKMHKKMSDYDELLLRALVGDKDSIALTRTFHTQLKCAIDACKVNTSQCDNTYLNLLTEFLYPIRFLSGIIVIIAFFYHLVSLAGLGIATFFPFFRDWFVVYTPAGRHLQDQIDGFKLYLSLTEADRINLVGTPPIKTPELYETYLPYAMALGVEERWTNQFSSVFKSLESQGNPYMPMWYHGRKFRGNSFGSEFTRSFNTAISSASTPPGSSSGSRGRGSSGRGGGGGGGGGW